MTVLRGHRLAHKGGLEEGVGRAAVPVARRDDLSIRQLRRSSPERRTGPHSRAPYLGFSWMSRAVSPSLDGEEGVMG